MKIGFKALEKIRRNPKSINDKGIAFFGGRSKFVRWQDSIGRFHLSGENLNEAERYLESSFSRLADNSLNKRDLKKYLDHLYNYDIDYKKINSQKIQFRTAFNFDLILNHTIGGQISRVDINTIEDGYSIYFFEKENDNWENELRFPLLQDFIANYFGCDNQDVNVGVYELINDRHSSTKFSKSEIEEAKAEMITLITEVNKFLK